MVKHSEQAAAALIAHKAKIDALLERLTAISANHFNADPEAVNWGDVGSAEEVARMLREAVAFMGA